MQTLQTGMQIKAGKYLSVDNLAVAVRDKKWSVFFFMVHNLFVPARAGQDLAPSEDFLQGCQWVFKPVLSPLLYKSKPF